MPIRSLLQKYWGHSSFRPLQEDIINSVLAGKDTLALLPTGGGKSICYQVPGLAREGVCVVISPLIALMKDQVESLKKKGIPAVAVHSGLMPAEIEMHLDNCTYGNIKFLYLSPERLEKRGMPQRLGRMNINLLAVDEAHCISQWGYDFRPSYLKIAAIREFLPNVPVLAVTATATGKVVEDIQNQLAFQYKNVFKGSFQRNNLAFYVFEEENKRNRLLQIISKLKGCGIIYTRNRRQTQEYAAFLEKEGVPAVFYHAGLTSAIRSKHQDMWMNGSKRVMVSTNAFGMGIDKPDVRFVVHLDLPDSLEAYFQEAGRAGRDGKKSHCIILFDQSDISNIASMHQTAFPDPSEIRHIYQCLANFCGIPEDSGEDFVMDFDLVTFSSTYKLNKLVVFNVLNFLVKEGHIFISDELMETAKVHFKVNKENLYQFQVQHILFDNFIKTLLRSYSGMFSDYVRINEAEIARRMKMTGEVVIKYLKQLDQMGIISYAPRKKVPQLIWLKSRINPKHLWISNENYFILKNAAEDRYKAVCSYVVSATTCREQQMLAYFDETGLPPCGRCDICIGLNRLESDQKEFEDSQNQILGMLKSSELSVAEITAGFPLGREKKVITVINWLIDNNLVQVISNGKLIKKH